MLSLGGKQILKAANARSSERVDFTQLGLVFAGVILSAIIRGGADVKGNWKYAFFNYIDN